jgi:hypothetical protein
MRADELNGTSNVVPFQTRSKDGEVSASDRRRDDIIRRLDLSKFERPRQAVENCDASMGANIAALVLLGLLVFLAKEDFCKLERSNLCAIRSDCTN